jgi:hypothetical protein
VITFEPETPWHVGQYVTLRAGDFADVKVVERVEQSEDGMETQYILVSQQVWELRQAGVRPYIELDTDSPSHGGER